MKCPQNGTPLGQHNNHLGCREIHMIHEVLHLNTLKNYILRFLRVRISALNSNQEGNAEMLVSEWPLSLPFSLFFSLSPSVHLFLGLSASVSLLRSLSLSQIKCITLIPSSLE